VNSMRLADGQILVGSGGANDIASAAAEVVVLASCEPGRLVARVDHVTSPGHGVVAIATDRCLLERAGSRWRMTAIVVEDGATADATLAEVVQTIGWDVDTADVRVVAESDLLAGGWHDDEETLTGDRSERQTSEPPRRRGRPGSENT
jgi:acyl CoA:acetate/3-ketoacid CoA transferase beta subunit